MGVLIREVSALYEAYSRGEESPLAELAIQYADYAVWQREWLKDGVMESQLAYWRKQLRGAPEALKLPTDKPRPAVQTFVGASQSRMLSPEVSKLLKGLSRREDVTLFMTLLAAWQTLLCWYTNQEHFVIGSPIANRNQVETEDLIGFFVNTLVLRCDHSGNPSFRELLRRVREVCLGAYAHQDLPFERLVEELRPERNPSYSPLYQVWYTLQTVAKSDLRLGNLSLQEFKVNNTMAKSDLALLVSDSGTQLKTVLEYNTDLFNYGTITRMLEHYETLLHSVIAQPDAPLAVINGILDEKTRQQQSAEERELAATELQILTNIKRKLIHESVTES